MLLKGKSGWCSSICPLLPIQRLYGQTPYKLVANSHCTPCVGCTKSCYDFNPQASPTWPTSTTRDPYWSGYRKLFAAAFPGLVVAFFTLPEARGGEEIASLYGQLALYLAVSIAVVLRARLAAEGLHAQAHDAVRGDRVLALLLVRRPRRGRSPRCGRARAVAIALAAGWVAAHLRQGARVHRAGRRGAVPRSRRPSRSSTSPPGARWPRTAR